MQTRSKALNFLNEHGYELELLENAQIPPTFITKKHYISINSDYLLQRKRLLEKLDTKLQLYRFPIEEMEFNDENEHFHCNKNMFKKRDHSDFHFNGIRKYWGFIRKLSDEIKSKDINNDFESDDEDQVIERI